MPRSMGHTYWGCTGCVATFIGDTSLPRAIKVGLGAINNLLIIGAAILAAYSFMLLHTILGFTIVLAMILAFIVIFVSTVAVVYNLWNICNSEEDHLTLTIQGTWTKVSRGSWVRLRDEQVTPGMLASDHYKQMRKSIGGWGPIGQSLNAASMVAAGDSGVIVYALRYVTSVVHNPDGPQVFASRDATKEWLSRPSVADTESAACCDTDESGCFLFCRNCNFKYKSFSTQANLAFISLLQFCFTAHGLSGTIYVGYSEPDRDFDTTLLLAVTGVEVLLLILSAFVSFLNSTDLKCCFCCINVDRHFRHRGPYIDLLNEIVMTAFKLNNGAVEQPPAVTPADNAVHGHPKYIKDYMRVKCGSEVEERILQQLLSDHHEQLYAKAFPSSPSAPMALTGAQIKLLDQFFSIEQNSRLVRGQMEDGMGADPHINV